MVHARFVYTLAQHLETVSFPHPTSHDNFTVVVTGAIMRILAGNSGERGVSGELVMLLWAQAEWRN